MPYHLAKLSTWPQWVTWMTDGVQLKNPFCHNYCWNAKYELEAWKDEKVLLNEK